MSTQEKGIPTGEPNKDKFPPTLNPWDNPEKQVAEAGARTSAAEGMLAEGEEDQQKETPEEEANAEALQQEILLTKLARLKGIDAVTERYIDQQQVDAVEYDKKREEYLKDPSLLTNQLARINRKSDIRYHLKPYLDDDGVMYKVLSDGEGGANLTSLLSERLANDKDFIKKCVEVNPQVLIWSEFADDRELRKQVIDADPGIVLQLWHNDNPEEWIQAVRLKPEVLFERRFTAKVPEEIFFQSKPVWEAAIKAKPELILDQERVPGKWQKDLELLLIAATEDPSILESPKLDQDIKKSLDALEKKFGKI